MVTMRIVERPDVKGKHVQCVSCGVNTRSHVLEAAEYEEYEEIWEEDDLQEYQGQRSLKKRKREEVIIRYRLHNEKTCMCHSCWLGKKAKAVKFLNKNKETWLKEGTVHLTRIKKFMSSWKYYQFGQELSQPFRKTLMRFEMPS